MKSTCHPHVCLRVRRDDSHRKLSQYNARVSTNLNAILSQHRPVYIPTIVGLAAYTSPNVGARPFMWKKNKMFPTKNVYIPGSLFCATYSKTLLLFTSLRLSACPTSRFTSQLGTMQRSDQHKPQGVAFARKFLAAQACICTSNRRGYCVFWSDFHAHFVYCALCLFPNIRKTPVLLTSVRVSDTMFQAYVL